MDAATNGGAIDWAGPDRAFANVGADWDPQFKDALDYTRAVKALTAKGGPYEGYSLSVTGHSLGGGLAQLAAYTYGLDGRSFDAPQLGNVTSASELTRWAQANGVKPVRTVGDDFTNYYVNKSPLRSAGLQYPGDSVNITGMAGRDTAFQRAMGNMVNLGMVPPLLDMINRHDRRRILDVFDEARRSGKLNQTGDAPGLDTLFASTDPRHPAHPDHALFTRIGDAVSGLGTRGQPALDNVTAALYVAVKQNPDINGIERVVASDDGQRLFALQRATNGQLERAMVDIASASGVDATRTLASFVAGQAPAAQDMATRGQEQRPPTPRMV